MLTRRTRQYKPQIKLAFALGTYCGSHFSMNSFRCWVLLARLENSTAKGLLGPIRFMKFSTFSSEFQMSASLLSCVEFSFARHFFFSDSHKSSNVLLPSLTSVSVCESDVVYASIMQGTQLTSRCSARCADFRRLSVVLDQSSVAIML